MPKLLALDLDGTTFSEGTTLSQINRRRLLEAKELGTVICFVTGRKQLDALTHLFDIADYIVLNNGGTAVAMPQGEQLYSALVDQQDMIRLIEFCTASGAVLHMFHGDYWGVNLITPELAEQERLYGAKSTFYRDVSELPFETTDGFVISGNCEAARLFIEREGLNLTCVYSEPMMMDVMPGGVNKWNGTSDIAKRLGIAAEEIIAVGNYYNDLEMIKGAGIGIAVQNAPDDIKLQADYVTERAHDDGAVAEIIERFIL